MCMCTSSAHLVSTTAPTPPIAFFLNMHNDVHIPALQELDCAFAHIFEVCGVRGDDVNYAEDALFSGGGAMAVVVVVVVTVVCVAV